MSNTTKYVTQDGRSVCLLRFEPATLRTPSQGSYILNKEARSVGSIMLGTNELWTILLYCSCAESTGMRTKRIQISRMIKF